MNFSQKLDETLESSSVDKSLVPQSGRHSTGQNAMDWINSLPQDTQKVIEDALRVGMDNAAAIDPFGSSAASLPVLPRARTIQVPGLGMAKLYFDEHSQGADRGGYVPCLMFVDIYWAHVHLVGEGLDGTWTWHGNPYRKPDLNDPTFILRHDLGSL